MHACPHLLSQHFLIKLSKQRHRKQTIWNIVSVPIIVYCGVISLCRHLDGWMDVSNVVVPLVLGAHIRLSGLRWSDQMSLGVCCTSNARSSISGVKSNIRSKVSATAICVASQRRRTQAKESVSGHPITIV